MDLQSVIREISRKTHYRDLITYQLSRKIEKMKKKQIQVYLKNQQNFNTLFQDLQKKYNTPHITQTWASFNKKIENELLPKPPINFLRNRTIRKTMFVDFLGNILRKELSFLKDNCEELFLKTFLIEDIIGKPYLVKNNYLTSHNTIHLMYHIKFFKKRTNIEIHKRGTIIEWGGGYGNLAKIIHRMNKQSTYIIIDIPIICCLQWLYLSTVLDGKDINIIKSGRDKIQTRKINIIPIQFLHNFNLQADVFIATWSLSESSSYSQKYVNNQNFFNAKNILIALQNNDMKKFIGRSIKNKKMEVIPIHFLPNQLYAFL